VEQYVTASPTGDNTIQRIRIAFWIQKATHTHSEYLILIVFPPRKRLRGRPSVLRYTYIACIVYTYSLSCCDLLNFGSIRYTTPVCK